MTPTSPATAESGQVEAWRREAHRALSAREFKRAHELCARILQRTPHHADALFVMGMIAAEHGNFGKAADVIQRAITHDPTRAEYFAQLGRCLIGALRPREAIDAARHALQLQPNDALTLDTIGVVFTHAGMHDEAVEPYRRAVALDPSKPAYRCNLGAALQITGDLDAAQAVLREAIRIDPSHHRAWSSLTQLARKALSTEDIRTLMELLDRAPTVDAELHLCHALAKHYEDQDDSAAAFRFLERGKRRKRAETGYAAESDRLLFETVRAVCTPAFLDEAGGSDSSEPIFIVGMPRTGTTLVERILSSHPEVFSAGELTNFALTIKRATRSPSNLVLDVETLRATAALDWAQVGEEYVASTRPRTGHTRHFIDKMPLNFMYAGFIRRALPKARIVCVRRHPLDTCLSNYRQLFATDFPYYRYAYDLLDTGRYYLQFDALIHYWRAAMPQRFHEIVYEDVVADIESEARKLVAFCGLAWHPACLDFHENAAPVATASAAQVRQPIYRTSIARWRRYENEVAPLRELLRASGVPTG